MTAIVDIVAREILDSRGNPTVEVDVVLEDGSMGRAAVPSGASTGAHEAVELRDGDKSRYGGKGVKKAVESVTRDIFDAISGFEAEEQIKIDEAMIALDGTPNKARLGANAILGVSLAVAKAAAEASNLQLYRYIGGTTARVLPAPMMNIVNGGVHADNPIDFQEFMIMPLGAPSLKEAVRWGSEVFQTLKGQLKKAGPQHQRRRRGRLRPQPAVGRGGARLLRQGDRGGRLQAGPGHRPRARPGRRASSSRTAPMSIRARARPARSSSRSTISPSSSTPIRSCRSRTASPRTTGKAGSWLTDKLGKRLQLVGDDLFVTNVERLSRGIKEGAANSILIKVNQIGTLTETLAAVDMAHRAGYTAVMSHRSGETEDFDHRRPRGGDQLRADQDRLALAARTGSPSTTSSSASRKSSATRPATPATRRSRRAESRRARAAATGN